ncbi:M48 family metallopeptidase [Bordetella holmesii]|uniref:Metalloprotease YggG n=3 Tax=Bordetella holmesii TaxID=35814 RepID=A0A158M6J3_9BORD|nr:M48 family metallopeptidase [Bordetella holmesii]AHV94658.1 peptidase M48 family protein [Bordetella holmesii ATCC 51541]AIT24868.1 peptidase M48 family protein [Bordetella holmesii 44057]EWM45439.1 peptidase M48 family protein [Bordetella holmesii 70147]EWM48804.1 peptidase M48 family protein [Bordetella holmesii 41130]AMD44145.1 peptidase [Bordetella holmesii H558]
MTPTKRALLWTVATGTLTLAGCANLQNMDTNSLMGAGGNVARAVSLSDADIVQLSDAACKESDAQSKIAPAGSNYAKRLDTIMAGFGGMDLNGQKINYKVYQTDEVNAWAMGNGCVRVYTGLMDKMNDDELRGVIGHEMGHVALGHTRKAMQTAYAVSAARTAAGAAGNSAISALSASQMGELTEKFINAQFSQAQESAADDYSFDLLTKKKMNRQGLVTAFEKLAELDGGQSGLLSSHPSSPARAKHIQQRIDSGK